MRLQHPARGTVVEVSGKLADRYLAAGWRDMDVKPAQKPAARKPAARKAGDSK